MTEPYHYWKFRGAVEALVHGEADLRQRILWALTGFAGIRDQDLPGPVREVYLEIQAQVTWSRDGDPAEGTWANTLRAMSDEDARAVADQIVHLYEVTCRMLEPVQPD